MAVNKVNFGGNTLIDLTNDTVAVDTLLKGITAHNAAGELITGTFEGGITAENLTAALITRAATNNIISQVKIPAGYFVNEDIILTEWATGQFNPAGNTNFAILTESIGFVPRYVALIANSDSLKNANMVLASFGNNSAGRAIYTGSKASLPSSGSFAVSTNGSGPTINDAGIVFPAVSSAKYGSFNYRWFALR